MASPRFWEFEDAQVNFGAVDAGPTDLVRMLLVEFAQGALVEGRAFDIDDVILNTTGALIGYLLLGRRLSRAVHL